MQPLEPTNGSENIEQSHDNHETVSEEPFTTFLEVKALFFDSNVLFSDIEDAEFTKLARKFDNLHKRYLSSDELDDELKATIQVLKNKSAAIISYKKINLIEKAYETLDEIIALIIGELND